MSRVIALSDCSAATEHQIHESRAAGDYVWIDLLRPTADDVARLGAMLGWHPLLVEDLQHQDQRAKIEDFDDHVFVIAYAAAFDVEASRVSLHENALVVHGDYLVTVRQDASPDFDDLRQAVAADAEPSVSEAALVHRVLDRIVDSVSAAADVLMLELDRLELLVETGVSPEVLASLRGCRRNIVQLRRLAIAQRDSLQSLADLLDAIPGFEVGLRDHFRDVLDHTHRVVGELEVGNDLLDATFESYYTMLVAKQGIVTQRLTVIATIFLPLTFVTGFFGMNFGWMVRAISTRMDFLVLGVGATLVTGLLLLLIFLRLRWW